jgi:O-antigen ligase
MLTLILMISVLLFGSVEIWSSTAIYFMVFTLGLIWVLRGKYRAYDISGTGKLLFITTFTFIAYGAIQTLPLPSSVLKMVSPLSYQMQSFFSVDAKSTMPISLNTYRTLYETIRGASFLTVFAISATSFSDRDKVQETLKALSIFGFILAIFAIVQKATWSSGNGIYWFRELSQGGSPFGPFVNRNHFAGLIGMLIPLGLGLSFTRKKKEKKILFGFMTVIMAVSLFFSLSRGGIISFFAGLALFTLLMLLHEKGSRKVWIISFFVLVVFSYVIYLGIDPIIERFYKTDVSSEERLVVWSSTWIAAKDFWLTGSGLGSFINLFPLYSPPSVRLIYDHAHNDYLEFFLETGLVGTSLLLVFAALLIYRIVKNPLRGRKSVLRAAALSSAFTMMVHSIFDFNLHILSNMLIFASILGMIAGLSGREDDRGGEDNKRKEQITAEKKETGRLLASMIRKPAARKRRSEPNSEDIQTERVGDAATDNDH